MLPWALGGSLPLSGKDEALIVSMGTGTAFVRARQKNNIVHIGGKRRGRRYADGLCGKFGGSRFETIIEKAEGAAFQRLTLQ